jgi:hypothetical protein
MPARVRVAAKIIVDRAGDVAGAPSADAASRDLQELSIDELQALIKDLNAQRAAAAKDVTPTAEGIGAERAENDVAHPPADDAPRH